MCVGSYFNVASSVFLLVFVHTAGSVWSDRFLIGCRPSYTTSYHIHGNGREYRTSRTFVEEINLFYRYKPWENNLVFYKIGQLYKSNQKNFSVFSHLLVFTCYHVHIRNDHSHHWWRWLIFPRNFCINIIHVHAYFR